MDRPNGTALIGSIRPKRENKGYFLDCGFIGTWKYASFNL